MSYDHIDDEIEKRFERECQLRAAICRKYAEQYYDETAGGKLPNLALIINDAISEAMESHFNFLRKPK